MTRNIQGGIVASRVWRFADLATRLEFLLGGFGWCNMPLHMVEGHILAGRLKRLVLAGRPEVELPLYVVHERGRRLGHAGRWLIDDLAGAAQDLPRRAPARRRIGRRPTISSPERDSPTRGPLTNGQRTSAARGYL